MRQAPGSPRKKYHRGDRRAGRGLRLESLETRQLFSAGSLDPNFAGTGVIQPAVAGGVIYENSVAVQPDQKIVTTAIVYAPNSAPQPSYDSYLELARYNADGSPDPNFGTGGKTDSFLNQPIRSVSQEVIAAGGKIVITGRDVDHLGYAGYIARFNADGTLDGTFGAGGLLDLGSGGLYSDYSISVQADGKIVAGYDSKLARFNLDGTPDQSFGQSGVVSLPAVAQNLAIASDGDIVVSAHDNAGLKVLVFDDDGHQLSAFSSPATQDVSSTGLLIENDGDLVVSGTVSGSNNSQASPVVVRLTQNLQLDASFGQGGVSQINQAGSGLGLIEEPNGDYVVGFAASVGTSPNQVKEFGLARLDQNGILDESFGTDGLVLSSIGNTPAGIAGQQDGNVMFVGANVTGLFDGVGIIARFLGDPVGIIQAPGFVKGPDQSLPVDGGSQSVPGWATSITTGAADEVGQALNFVVQTGDPTLFAALPSITTDGTLLYTPAAGAIGATVVTVSLHDNGGTAGGGSDTSAAETFIIDLGSAHPWQNPISANDVNGSGDVSALDALVVINEINAHGAHALGSLPNAPSGPSAYLDVNADGFVNPLDALVVINLLNAPAASAGQKMTAQAAADAVAASSLDGSSLLPAAIPFGLPSSTLAPVSVVAHDASTDQPLAKVNSARKHPSTDLPAGKEKGEGEDLLRRVGVSASANNIV